MNPLTLSRRRLLVGAGAAASAVAFGACGRSTPSGTDSSSGSSGPSAPTGKGSETRPLATPAQLHESPRLAELVAAGKLPPVADRLPVHPYVIPHRWVERGTYGGILTMLTADTAGGGGVGNWSYGFSLLRFLNDGTTVGPGIVESWTTNEDTTAWTFHLRKGLRWSDGHPATTADIAFWWTDMANDPNYLNESVPDDCRSASGKPCALEVVDAATFTMTFDTPAPLTAERLATWSNGYGGGGPSWIVPAHYVRDFHPRYNKSVPANWAGPGGLWMTHCMYRTNPKCPTLTGHRLTKYSEGRSLTWERNPYYYAVTRDGDQLPYLDGFVQTAVADIELSKVQVTAGKVDWSDGKYSGIGLSDVSTLTKNKDRSGFEITLWDSGSGTGSVFFLNLDYENAAYRAVFNEPKFRKALSLAFNRPEAQRSIYFQQGEVTTGAMSPKASDFLVGDEGRESYAAWRDAYVTYDPAKAKALLDEIGVVDTDGDGIRELPDGSPLKLSIDYPATAIDEHKQKDAQLVRDWKLIGIAARQNPVPPLGYDDNWKVGKYMGHSNWQVGDGPNLLQYPTWLVPIEPTRWAPLQGQMYVSRGTPAFTSEADVDPYKRKPPRKLPEPGGPIDRLWKLYDTAKVETDPMKRFQAVWSMCKIHREDGPFFQGTVANYPQVVVRHRDLRNVPVRENFANGGFTATSAHPTPAVYDPETFYWANPQSHGGKA